MKKFALNKITVSDLTASQLSEVKGGGFTANSCQCITPASNLSYCECESVDFGHSCNPLSMGC